MALTYCTDCGKQFSDKAPTCPNCGCPNRKLIENEKKENEAIQIQAAKNEMITANSIATKSKIVVGFISIIFGGLMLWLFIYASSRGINAELFYLVPCFFIFYGFWLWGLYVKNKKRAEELSHIVSGEQLVKLCPFCKSTNISMNMVQAGSITGPQTARISDNINPLHPFTHTNVKTSAANTQITYGNMWQCNNCGKVFTQAQGIWK